MMCVKYPNKTTRNPINLNTINSSAGRGMSLEHLLNQANEYYRVQEIACIYKKPTPIQVVQVDYKSRKTAKIIEAYYSTPSTTDYNGIYNQHYIDFEAKQTNLASLPFHNFHLHQIQHMEEIIKQGGICFVIIYYTKKNHFFLVPASIIVNAYNNQALKNNRKSFSLADAQKYGHEISQNTFPILDYLAIVQKIFLGGTTVGE